MLFCSPCRCLKRFLHNYDVHCPRWGHCRTIERSASRHSSAGETRRPTPSRPPSVLLWLRISFRAAACRSVRFVAASSSRARPRPHGAAPRVPRFYRGGRADAMVDHLCRHREPPRGIGLKQARRYHRSGAPSHRSRHRSERGSIGIGTDGGDPTPRACSTSWPRPAMDPASRHSASP